MNQTEKKSSNREGFEADARDAMRKLERAMKKIATLDPKYEGKTGPFNLALFPDLLVVTSHLLLEEVLTFDNTELRGIRYMLDPQAAASQERSLIRLIFLIQAAVMRGHDHLLSTGAKFSSFNDEIERSCHLAKLEIPDMLDAYEKSHGRYAEEGYYDKQG